jgi:hypothetical protein
MTTGEPLNGLFMPRREHGFGREIALNGKFAPHPNVDIIDWLNATRGRRSKLENALGAVPKPKIGG